MLRAGPVSTPRWASAVRARSIRAAHAETQRARLSSVAGSQSSVNPEEIAHFSRLSQQWWDERGEFGLLHKMNPVRMQFIRNKVVREERTDNTPSPHLV